MEHIFDILILGGGPAGYTAALYGARAGLDTLLIEQMAPGGQMALTGDIDNYPGFETGIDGFTLGMKMKDSAERFGAKTEFATVLSTDLDGKIKKAETTVGTFLSKTVIIATGANARTLGLPKETELTGKGIHYCAHCDGRFYKDKTVAVVGGGNSAVQDALYLSKLAKKVYIIHRRDTLKAEKIYHEPLMKTENTEFLWNSTVTGITENSRLNGIEITNSISGESTHLPVDGLFISIGRIPATEFVKDQVSTDKAGYIIADESTRTDIDGVFAAGDVRTKPLRQVVTAVSDGAVSVHFAGEYIDQISI